MTTKAKKLVGSLLLLGLILLGAIILPPQLKAEEDAWPNGYPCGTMYNMTLWSDAGPDDIDYPAYEGHDDSSSGQGHPPNKHWHYDDQTPSREHQWFEPDFVSQHSGHGCGN